MIAGDRNPRGARRRRGGRRALGILGLLAATGLAAPGHGDAQTLTPERALLHRARVEREASAGAAATVEWRQITGERALLGGVPAAAPREGVPAARRDGESAAVPAGIAGERALLGRGGGPPFVERVITRRVRVETKAPPAKTGRAARPSAGERALLGRIATAGPAGSVRTARPGSPRIWGEITGERALRGTR